MSSARPAAPGFFPLDETLGLLPGPWSPRLVACIVRLGALLPFEQVPELLAFLTGIHLSVDTVRRITERAGAAQVAIEEQALARLEQDLPPVPVGAAVQQVSADGAMVPLVGGAWTEVRTVAIGTLVGGGEEASSHATAITYFSRRCSAHDFIRHAALPCHERGTAGAPTVVAVMDGADWLQEFIDAHCPHAVRILDFPHAVEYLAKVAQAAFGTGSRDAAVWLDEWAPRLKREGPEEVLQAIRQLPMPDDDARVVQTQVIGYLTKRRAQLQYDQFQAAGYPIGSGMVESANKLVVEARLKGSGMHWAPTNVTPMLALRGILCSHRWEQAWPGIWQELRRREAKKRRARRQARQQPMREQKATVPMQEERTPESAPPSPPKAIAGRPTAAHPWKHGYDQRLLARAAAKL